MKRILIFYLLLVLPLISHSQNKSDFSIHRDSVNYYLQKISNWENSDRIKFENNECLKNYMNQYLKTDSFTNTELDSIQFMGIVKSEDEQIKIYTWMLTSQLGLSSFFGYVQKFSNNQVDTVYYLNDQKTEELNHFFQQYSNDNWFGSLYYSIHKSEKSGQVFYTLLGYDPKDIHSNRKVIDVLSFDKDSNIYFGLPIFKRGNNLAYRVIFEFTERASMMLRYDQKYDMIIFDHLSPISPEYSGNPRFYGPDFSYDALKFEESFWVYKNDVDIRNPEMPSKTRKEYKYSW